MKKNIGNTDKSIRIIIALLIIILYFYTDIITGILGIILLIFAAILIITSLISYCPLYTVRKLNTDKKK